MVKPEKAQRVFLPTRCNTCNRRTIKLKDGSRLCLPCGINYRMPRPGFKPESERKK